ncbi:MAG: GIY-YIG nuclease family protein [Fusobacteriota bacterium]
MSEYNWVYMLKCADDSIYVGMSNDVHRRFKEHQNKTARCKYTRRKDKQPLKLVAYWKVFGKRGNALKVEIFIKQGRRKRKDKLLKDPTILEKLFKSKKGENIKIEYINKAKTGS